MKKRLLSWLLVLSMVISLIPSTLVTTAFAAENPSAQASGQAGKTKVETTLWPSDLNADITDFRVTGTIIPGDTLTVKKGKTLIVHGNGTLSGTGRAQQTPFFIVEDGGHLVLDNVTVTLNKSDSGTVVVQKGGLLDLGYNDQKDRFAPSITGNTSAMQASAARNLVIADGATVRLNQQATKPIGVSYLGTLYQPVSVMAGGRYALQGSDVGQGKITSDVSNVELILCNDQFVLRNNKAKILCWDPYKGFSKLNNGGDSGWLGTTADSKINDIYKKVSTSNGQKTDVEQWRSSSYGTYQSLSSKYNANSILAFDFIEITGPLSEVSTQDKAMLNAFLSAGGRVFIQTESKHWERMNNGVTAIARQLNGAFRMDSEAGMSDKSSATATDNIAKFSDNEVAKTLTKSMTPFHVDSAGYIRVDGASGVSPLMTTPAYNFNPATQKYDYSKCANVNAPLAVDQYAGDDGRGVKYGRLTVMSDLNPWAAAGVIRGSSQPNMIAFATNMINDAVNNRVIAATGVNPNEKVVEQATTTTTETTPYRTPYAALQKAVESSTVTLLTKSNTALTPTRDELLFQESTLAYETGSKYDGSKIYADTAGVYLDITKTGEVNLRSGTVTVTPKDKNYVLTMNGTMDQDGTAITDGYKITAEKPYQLIADDPTSPILPQNGGKARIVIPNKGESVTVDYGNGKIVTYTAKTANDKIYLGWYQVKKQTPANMTWTDADKAWHGHTFTTTLEPNAGYEINGENLTIADTDNAMTGGYTLTKQGDAETDPKDNTISWTTYSTADGKVTVKQQHLHSGGSDRNGIAILTVQNVHADISIGAGNNTVNAKAPTIYVVGIGKRTGHADVQLWEYTTIRNTKDGILDKPVSGWPWEKWKVSSAASGNGTESDYKQNKVTLTSDATKLDTSSETAQYTINLETGDKVVVFYYDWNMVNVTIKATDANGNPIPDYTDQVVEYESNKKTTITAPNLIGYQPVGGQNTKDFTPSETNKEITFQYEKTTGNLIYKAVYVDATGAKRELGTFSGGTLVQGQAPNKSAQYAPRFDNYELADKNADGVASAESYTGTDITVTYTYKAKVKTIPVEAYVETTSGVRLLNDTTTYKDITTGQTITVTAPDIAGYKVKGAASQTVFVTNDTGDGQKVVFLYEKDDDNNAYVLVKLVDSSNGNKLISSYQVPGVKDKAQLIKAPAAPYGYKADPAHPNEDQTVTPTGPKAPYTAEVVFRYVPNVHTVTIELKDVSETPAKPLTVNNYVASYKVVDGEGLTITAPSIYGYTMAANAAAVKQLTNITKDETVTFEYEPIDKQMVYIHVKGVGPDNKTLFESRESVTHGTASKEVNVFTLPGLKLASATVGGTDKTNAVANGKLTVNLRSVTKGGTVEVLLTYESNMANVTVKAMYNSQPLQSYTTSLEKGVPATINAPSVPGYTADAPNKPITPGDDPTANTVTFTYTKDKGNVTVVVVDKDGNKELYRKDGGTVARDSNIDLTGKAAAPTIEYYKTPTAPKSVLVGSTEVNDLTNYTYDGVGDIIVTYEYTRKTQDVIIVKKDEDTKKEITRETLQSLPVGKSHAFNGTVSIPTGYAEVSDRNPTSYFVEDKPNQTVTFWYKNTSADQYTQITVNLICDNKVFQSYPVTAIKGQPTTILAPTWTGYEFAGTPDEKVKTVTPTGSDAPVEFEYTITNPKTVTVVLKDNSNTANPDATLKTPAGYTTSYTLKEGDSVEIWAPSIDGYTLMSATLGDTATQEKQFVKANYAALANGETVVTFRYFPVTQANFVKHTVKFMLGDHLLYSHEKMIAKGNGTQVPYSGDDVKYMVPGYAYDSITYEVNGVDAPTAANVTDAVNATIIYHFVEDAATVTIKKSGTSEQDTVLTGYRKGQTVQVVAPVVSNYALTGDLIQTVTLNGANTDVTFNYVAAGQVTFTLKELNADGTEGSIIAVINGEAGKTYDANAKDGSNPLDLSKYGYTYAPSNLTSAPFNVGGAGKVESLDLSQPIKYVVYYSKDLRTVDYVPVDKAKLDKDGKTLDDVKDDPTELAKYTIKVTPVTPEKARVGETYKAVAQSFNGWALKDDFSKLYQVEKGTESLKVYFLYEQKTTGTVTVHYHFGEGADNKGKLINEYSITAVAGEKVQISALEYFNDNKYHLRNGQTNPYVLTVTDQAETVDFYYEANFVTVTTKVNLDGTDTDTHETYEVIKDTTTHSGSTTLYPPEKAGYTLIGITADGATLNNGGADQLPTEYADNKLALTGLATDATVTYYYKTTKASEYQTTLTVEYKYNGYDLATAKTIKANTGEANPIDIPAFDGYTASTYNFTDGSTVKVTSSGINGADTVSVTPAEKTATLTITYTRPDGSIVLPGKGDKIGDGNDIIVKPTDPNTPPTLNPGPNPAEGSVTIPKDPAGNTGTVTRPKDPTKPADGKEDIIVPGGTTIDKDGTIHLPDGGGDITPDQKIPDALPNTYVAITYDSNNGSGDVKKEIGKKGELKVAGSLFTHPTSAKFEGWNDSGLGSGTAYAEDKTVDTSITLYAKWSANYKYRATITYKPNDGTTGKDVFQNVGHDTDPKLKATLQSNTFQVSGWLFGGWNEMADGSEKLRQPNDTWELADQDVKTLYAQWYKVNADGSITVPGKDGNPNNKDTNATANGNGNVTPKLNPTRNDKGEIEVPKGGSVTLPDGSVIGMPDGGKLLPDGTVVINRPDKDGNGNPDDGTITIPGKTDPANPDVTDKNNQPEADATVIELVYQINDGKSHDEVTVKVVKGDTVSILDCPFTWAGHQFVNWMGTDNQEYASGANYTAGDNDLELHAQWVKVNDDGSIELPGKDGSMTTPKDNVLVTPDNHPVGNLDKKNDGSVEVKGEGATVNRPKDPGQPDQGKENIKVPEGTIVKPDGTIILPGGGGTINPDNKLPGATPTSYISVVYKANGGTGDDVIDLIKNDQTTINARTNPFTNGSQTFTGWNTADNGVGGTAYGENAPITIPNNSNIITLYAQWGKAEYKHTAKITYQANDGVTNAIEDTVGANDSTKFSINLRSNPFSVSGWDFGGWNTEANGTGTLKAANALVEVTANNNQIWYAQWYKVGANGSITVPGDGNPNTTGDNVTANGTGVTRDTTTGNIEIPAGGNAVKGNGETIALPNGGTLKPDGTLIIDKPNGGQIEVKPDGSTDPNANVVTLTYEANNGTNDTRKVYTTKGEAIAPLAADTFSYSGHAFLYWKSGDTIFKTIDKITPTDAMTLSAVWAKGNPDVSIELPGKDGELEAPDNEDNVIVTPDKPDGKVTPQPDGSVKVEDNGGTVTRPTDPKHPETGKEEIKVPEGTVVEPDGTIKLPDGTVIAPDKRIPDDVTPTDYFVVTYEPGDGSGDVIRDVITKNADTTLRDEDTFTAPNGKIFDGWLDGAQTKHDAGETLTVSASMTFTAQWKDGTPTPPAPKYSATIVFDPNTGDATATQTVTSADSTTITRNFDAYTQHFTAPAGWTFMGWSTKQVASQSSSFYADGAEETLKDGDTLNLYAILYKLDADTKVITLPGKGGQPEGGDDVTVTPGAGADLTVDKGFIKAPAGSEIKQPANATPIKVIEGEVNVYPDGSVFVPEGSKVQLPDGTEVDGEATIDPDGNPDTDNTKPIQRPDGTIVLPGENGKTGDPDDITIAPAGPNQPAGRIDEDGNVTITDPDGADVNLPGNTPEDIKVPNGTVIKPNGDMTLLYTIRYVDGSGTEIKTATVKSVRRGISATVDAATITGYTVSGEATKTASGEVSANLADYIITFTYTKNNTSGGGSSGGGGGGSSSTVSSYTIKASAGNGGIISPSGNVSVKRDEDQSFHINPINGYRISDVIVDGKSVGAVSTYTFDSVKANHTIQVKFVKYNSIVADPEVTGVAGWLQTKEHNGYMGGYGNGLFGPNDNMTRAQAARMFYNLLLEKDVPVTVSFTDVPADAWYAEAVNTLASLGVIKGIGDDQFAPNRTITRAEFTVIAMRFANISADVTNPFTDIATNDWYYTAVTSAVSYGWINGYSDGSFRPQATITRAEVVTIVNRMLNRTADRNFVDSNATAQFDDVPNTYWAYYNIMEATIAHDHSIDNDGVESWGKQK